MPQVKNVHISAALTNLAIQYKNMMFVAEKIFPVVSVVKESDKYYKFKKEELIDVPQLRAAGAAAHEVNWDVTSDTYTAEEYSLSHLVPDRIVNNSDVAVRPRQNTTLKLTKWIRLGYERRVQTIVQSTASITNTSTPSTKWDNASATAKMIKNDVNTAIASVRTNCGVEPNRILLSKKVMDAILVTLATSATNTMYKEWLSLGATPAELFGLQTVVAGATYNTAKEGQSESLSDIWNDNVVVYYVEETPSLESLSLGYTLRARDFRTRTWRDETREGEFVEVGVLQDEKLVAQEAGYILSDVLT